MMRRREFITLRGGAVMMPLFSWPLAARAEAKPKMLRVGYVGVQSPDAPLYKAFRDRMAELGYQDGRNFNFEYIQTPDIEGYGPAYRELAARKVDVLFAVGEPGLRAAQAAAGARPIALLAVDFAAAGRAERSAPRLRRRAPHGRRAGGCHPGGSLVHARPCGHRRGTDPGGHSLDLRLPRDRRTRGADELRRRSRRSVPRHGRLCRPRRQGRQAGRPADRARHPVPHGDQPQGGLAPGRFGIERIRCACQRGVRMKRRAFITLLGGGAAWSLAARAQQAAIPVVGFLSGRSPNDSVAIVIAFQRGLGELGYFDGQNVEIDFRWALSHYDQLPALARDLVRRKVTVIVATGGGVTSTRAAKAATSSIPIIFVSGGDPIDFGLVESLNKPGGNLTGVSFLLGALEAKRIELLHELLPKATLIGALVNPTFPASKTRLEDAQVAAQ